MYKWSHSQISDLTPYQQFIYLDKTGKYTTDPSIIQFADMAEYEAWLCQRQ